MQRMALLYLHQSTVSEPIEFFHSLFLAFYHRDPVTLWTIQEEDPSLVRYITDTGEETMPGRLAGMGVPADFSAFVQEMQRGPAGEEGECAGCEFRLQCQGYFKWPLREYRCDGVQGTAAHPAGCGRGVADRYRFVPCPWRRRAKMTGSHFSIILLPTLGCNADCEYCFENKTDHHLSLDHLAVLIEKVMDFLARKHIDRLSIYWQGGEVMTLPPEWFEQAHSIIRRSAEARRKEVVIISSPT